MWRVCLRKIRYKTLEKAKRAANRAFEKRGTYLRVYLCPVCGGYHLTHKKEVLTNDKNNNQ